MLAIGRTTARATDAAAGRRAYSWWVMFPAPASAGRQPWAAGMPPQDRSLVLTFTHARPRKASNKDILAHQRIDDHEKLCRIMQENTNKQIKELHTDIHRIEKILISSTAFLMTSMIGIIVALVFKIN